MIKSYIKAITYYLPSEIVSNDSNDRMTKKIGIFSKHVTNENEFASDLAYYAAEELFSKNLCNKDEIDMLIYCTQSPDYFLPTTACIIQDRLGLKKSVGAFDYNLGCSGYGYGLSMAKGFIETGIAKNVLLLTADTYSKYINPLDGTVKPLFGDGASATLITGADYLEKECIGSIVFGTDGSGAENLIVPAGGLKEPISNTSFEETEDSRGNVRTRKNLYMNGKEIFNFAVREIPRAIEDLLSKNNQKLEDYDYFIFHQANEYMMETLRRKLGIPKEKFSVQLADCGNTVSSTIPIALYRDFEEGKIKVGDNIMLVGFGVGYSWFANSIIWNPKGENLNDIKGIY
ncbi:3-oxoacyl-ACP synthase III family protein [Ureibacillus massiliensis]|uniref:3-oxoacyl-ACP synthase III family protein n=1 Tax=Ureibacillus massiliensis TaxID=292806 RepID=UPI000567B932|nr:ketoacyl-ACP synthase III [Ureibacillus massiliensis]